MSKESSRSEDERLVAVRVESLLLDPRQNSPVLILRELLQEEAATASVQSTSDIDSAGTEVASREEGRAGREWQGWAPDGAQRAQGSQGQARILPIWIGLFEASAIQMHLEGAELPRPLTHDLLGILIGRLGGSLESVVVHALVDGTYYAKLVIEQHDSVVEVDARPSDAIALALRCDAPLFVAARVFEELDERSDDEQERDRRLKEWFDGLDPDDLGKYTM